MRPYHLLSSARNGRSSLASRHAASGGAGASAAATPLTRLHGAAPHTRCPRFALFSHWQPARRLASRHGPQAVSSPQAAAATALTITHELDH